MTTDPRSLAVEIVDAIHGHTVEFSNAPNAHQHDYDHVEGIIADRLASEVATLRAENERLRLSDRTLEAVVNCLQAVGDDPREPQRYRGWYAEALTEVKSLAAFLASVSSEGSGE